MLIKAIHPQIIYNTFSVIFIFLLTICTICGVCPFKLFFFSFPDPLNILNLQYSLSNYLCLRWANKGPFVVICFFFLFCYLIDKYAKDWLSIKTKNFWNSFIFNYHNYRYKIYNNMPPTSPLQVDVGAEDPNVVSHWKNNNRTLTVMMVSRNTPQHPMIFIRKTLLLM